MGSADYWYDDDSLWHCFGTWTKSVNWGHGDANQHRTCSYGYMVARHPSEPYYRWCYKRYFSHAIIRPYGDAQPNYPATIAVTWTTGLYYVC